MYDATEGQANRMFCDRRRLVHPIRGTTESKIYLKIALIPQKTKSNMYFMSNKTTVTYAEIIVIRALGVILSTLAYWN